MVFDWGVDLMLASCEGVALTCKECIKVLCWKSGSFTPAYTLRIKQRQWQSRYNCYRNKHNHLYRCWMVSVMVPFPLLLLSERPTTGRKHRRITKASTYNQPPIPHQQRMKADDWWEQSDDDNSMRTAAKSPKDPFITQPTRTHNKPSQSSNSLRETHNRSSELLVRDIGHDDDGNASEWNRMW